MNLSIFLISFRFTLKSTRWLVFFFFLINTTQNSVIYLYLSILENFIDLLFVCVYLICLYIKFESLAQFQVNPFPQSRAYYYISFVQVSSNRFFLYVYFVLLWLHITTTYSSAAYYYFTLGSFSHRCSLMVSHWSLSDSKSLKSPGLFSVLWPIVIMLQFELFSLFLLLPIIQFPLSIFRGLVQCGFIAYQQI